MGQPTFRDLGASTAQGTTNLEAQLLTVHGAIVSRYPSIDRVALAAYDPQTDALTTFVSSNQDGERLDHYAAKLADVPSLRHLAEKRQTRVVDDIPDHFSEPTQHTAWLRSKNYQSSLTVPIFKGDDLGGFLFFDSKQLGVFDTDTVEFLEVFANLISQLYLLQLQVVRSMVSSVQLASGLARIRDLETGQHLERMGAYSRLMAVKLADSHHLRDEFIEYVHLFAPLHDVGKVGVPDHILHKPGKLDADEWVIMRRHVEIGEAIVKQMGKDLQMGNGLAFEVMHNIVAGHHERGDGSGYPRGLTMEQIPLEARIVAVADVYDALSIVRPYKRAWTPEQIAIELDKEVALGRLDADCVRALMSSAAERAQIYLQFEEQR